MTRDSVSLCVGGNQCLMRACGVLHIWLVGWPEGVIPTHDTMIAYHRRAKMSIFFFNTEKGT